jgi:hypothetical protein
MNISQVNAAILAGTFTNDELTSIGDAIKFARAKLARQVANTLKPGAQVQFTSNRNGVTYKGTLEKIKLKNAIVATQQGRYNVPMSMLEAA